MSRAKRAAAVLAVSMFGLCSQASAAAPTPPFAQCPAVGADSGCALVIYITSSGQIGVAGDPSQGPFDGVEDTLIGVQNDSSRSIASIPLAATTAKDLFGFDGDGLCTFGISGCPFGSTGYEGPGVSFTNLSTDYTSGTVNFSPSIAPGGHAYFSLEEALATQPPYDFDPGTPKTAGRYVSLGDSYASGEANDPFMSGTDVKDVNECHRSVSDAYGPSFAAVHGFAGADFTFGACSGAIMADITEKIGDVGQWTDPPQLDRISPYGQPDPDVSLVSLTIGGNDAAFKSGLETCVSGFGTVFKGGGDAGDCAKAIKRGIDKANTLVRYGGKILITHNHDDTTWDFCGSGTTRSCTPNNKEHLSPQQPIADLDGMLGKIRDRAPNAHIVVQLYPRLFSPLPPSNSQCNVGQWKTIVGITHSYYLDHSAMVAINAAVDTLDTAISQEVAAAHARGIDVEVADARSAFDANPGHGVRCIGASNATSEPWIHGAEFDRATIGVNASPFSFHPNADGQQAFRQALEDHD
jgi:hypothetical protein